MTPRRAVPLPRLLAAKIAEQDGTITRRQVLDAGADSAFVRRKLDRGEWVSRHPGVYLTHTGPPTWRQQAWLAVLSAEPAALCLSSAVIAAGGVVDGEHTDDGPIHIAVDVHRNLSARPAKSADGRRIVVHYTQHLDDLTLWNCRPPRVRPEYAILELAGRARSEHLAIARLTEGVQSRITTAERMLAALGTRHNFRRQPFLRAVLNDISQGTCSVLEHRYLTDVERAHGLPTATRQAPTKVGRAGFRDVEYAEFRVVVELDGRVGHDDAHSRDRDLERDLDALAAAGCLTARIGSGQVYDRACATAGKVAGLLAAGGWTGEPRRCRRTCSLAWRPPEGVVRGR